MYTVVVTIHIIVCVILVLTVLLQQGKGAEVGAVFGSSEAMFGSAGPASALNKVTTVVAIVFMITSLALTYLAAHKKGDSVMEDVKVEVPATASETKQPDVHQRSAETTAPVQGVPGSKTTVDNTAGDVVKAASETKPADAGAAEEETAPLSGKNPKMVPSENAGQGSASPGADTSK